jgi:hypothetical protein
MLKIWCKLMMFQESFYKFKTYVDYIYIYIYKIIIFNFSFFLYIKCAPFLFKIGDDISIDN